MKKIIKNIFVCFVATIMLVGCSSGSSEKKKTATKTNEMVGTLVSTSDEKIKLKNNDGDTLSFDTSTAVYDLKNGIEVGNWIHVFYTGEIDGTDTSAVKVTKIIDDDDNIKSAQAKVSVEEASGVVYAIANVNVRSTYSTTGEILGKLTLGQEVKRTGVTKSGWTRIDYNGKVGYVSDRYLSETKPKTTVKSTVEKQTVGKVKSLSNNLLTIDHKGLTFVFDITNAKQNTTGGLVKGREVAITFTGDLDGSKVLPASLIEDAVE